MQSIYPLVEADFTAKGQEPVNKIEIFVECCAYDLCDFYGKNYLIEAHYSSGQRELSYRPVAAEFTAIIDATDGLLHPKNTDSPFYSYLKVGRKILFHTGLKKDGIDYLWQWFEGVISDVQINNNTNRITITGFDYTQYLTEVKLKSPDNYWGAIKDTVTVADQADYSLAALGCKGAYIAYLDGTQIYAGDSWIYDEGTEKLWFLPSQIPVANGIELLIYYYTAQAPENIVADILVTAGLYPSQAAALANMDYEATGVTIDRVRFNTGVSALYAIQKICERVDYEFFFSPLGVPVFRSIAAVGGTDFTFGKELISSFDYIENIDEVKNHIIIEGEEYSVYDELYRILDGSEIMYTLDEIPDGAAYGRMALTSIAAGKIIIAGCDAEVTNRMFLSPTAKTNMEAWIMTDHVTYIDGGKIYTNTIVVNGLAGAVTDRMFGSDATKTNIEAWRHASNVTLIDGGDIYTGSVTAQKLTIGPSPNLLKSKYTDFQSFEDGQVIGSGVAGGAATCDATAFYIGDRCLELATTGDCYVYLGSSTTDYNIRLKPSTKYIVSFYAAGNVGENILAFIKQDDTVHKVPAKQTVTTAWVRYEFIITTDSNLTNSGLLLLQGDGAGHTFLFDAIQVEEASAAASPEASPYAPSGTVEIHGGQVEAETMLVDKLIVGGSGNTEAMFEVYQGEDKTQIFRLRSTSIDHKIIKGGGEGYDWGAPTDCYYYMRKKDALLGGVHCSSFTEEALDISYELYALYGTGNKLKTADAKGAINLAGLRGNPYDVAPYPWGYRECEANDNILVLKTKPNGSTYQAIFIFDEGGDFFYGGAAPANFQDENDIKLLKELEDIFGDKIPPGQMKEKDVAKKHKIVHIAEVDEIDPSGNRTGEKSLSRMISNKKLNALLIGNAIQTDKKMEENIRQMNEKIESLENKVESLEN